MYDQFGNPIYGDQQSQYTMGRAAYGDVAAGMMMGAGHLGGGAMMGARDMMSDLGSRVMPVTYSPPARVQTGYYGMYSEPTSFTRGLASTFGMTGVPRGTTALEHSIITGGDFGERVGSGVASAGTMLAGTFGIGALMSPVMRAAGRAAGTSMAAGLGLGAELSPLVGAVGGGVGAMFVAPMIGAAVAGQVMEGVNQRRAIEGQLNDQSFRFVGAGSDMADPRLSSGASRQARMGITDMIRGMDVKDPMLNTKDLTSILGGAMQNGLMNDAGQSMGEFQKRFKEVAEGVKTVTSVLHQTLEQGLQTIKELKGIGIDPSRVKEIVGMADMTGRMAGRTGSEMIGVGLQGAEMFRGTGVSMEIGAQSNMMNLARIRAARDAGLLSQEAVSQAGGEEAMAQGATANGLAFSQSMFGRGFSAAFFNPAAQGFGGTGGFNMGSFMQAAGQGGGDFVSQAMRAAGNLSNPGALRTYQANQEKFMSEMGKQFGGRGLEIAQDLGAMSMAAFTAKATGASTEVEFVNALKQQGVGEPEIERRLSELRNPTEIFRQMQQSIGATRAKTEIEESSQNFVVNRMSRAIKGGVVQATDFLARPIDRGINALGQAVENFKLGQIYGAVASDTSGVDTSMAQRGKASLAGTSIAGKSMFAREAGDALLGVLENGALEGIVGKEDIIRGGTDFMGGSTGATGKGVFIGTRGGRSQEITQSALERLAASATILGMNSTQAEKLADKTHSGEMRLKVGAALENGSIAGATNVNQMLTAVFGKEVNAGNVTSQQMADLTVALEGTSAGERLAGFKKDIRTGANALNVATIASQAENVKAFDKLKASVGGEGLATGVVERLARAAAEKDPKEKRRLELEAYEMESHVSGVSEKEVKGKVDYVRKRLSADSNLATQINTRVDAIAATQAAGGSQEMSAVLMGATMEAGFDKDPKAQAMARSVAAKVAQSGLVGLSEQEINAFSNTSIGSAFKSEASLIGDLAGGKVKSKEDFRKRIANFASGQRQDELVGMFGKAGGDFTEVAQALNQDIMGSLRSSRQVGSAAGASPGDNNQASAAQNAATQTSINLATLDVMRGLAVRLNVK